jgi:DNA-binding transcriptional LysR family regulator
MELRHLRYFVVVAEELSFTEAARRLGMAQPPLSVQIRQLETELDAPLFDRSQRQVRLTEAGSEFLKEAQAVLARVDEAAERIRNAAAGRAGAIRLGYTSGTLSSAILKRFRKFCRKQRGAKLQLKRIDAGSAALAFSEGGCDGLVVHRGRPLPEGVEIDLEQSHMCVAVSPKHRLAERAAFTMTDLIGEVVLVGSCNDRSVAEHVVISQLTKATAVEVKDGVRSEAFVDVALGNGIAACTTTERLAPDTALVAWEDPKGAVETILVVNPKGVPGMQALAEFLQQ